MWRCLRMAGSRLAAIFKLNKTGFNLRRAVSTLVAMLLPVVVLTLLHQEIYIITMVFAVLFVGFSDPGGEYSYRAPRIAGVAVVGALLTALGFGIGGRWWGWVVLAAFVVTVFGGLAVKYGLHRFTAGVMLNVWFLVAISLPGSYELDGVQTSAWAQTVAWLIGSALVIAYVTVMWLARGRTAQPQPAADVVPDSVEPVALSRQVILFAVIRAVAVSIAVAIAFGLQVQNADWMPVATLVAMRPSLQESALVAEQRLAGAIIGALVAAFFLFTVGNNMVLLVVIVVLAALAGSLRAVNYAWYCAGVAGAVLIGMDLSHPSNLADEGRRVFFNFIGVGLAVVVMFLAGLLNKRTAATTQGVGQAR